MQADIHPKYVPLDVTCSCGNTFKTQSANTKGNLHIEACAKCHPAYTGQKSRGAAGGDSVNRFNEKYSRRAKKADAA